MITYNRFEWSSEWKRDDVARRLSAFEIVGDVLDVGCADGAAVISLHKKGHTCTAIDQDSYWVDIARECVERSRVSIPIHIETASGSFREADTVLGMSILHWKPDFQGTLWHLCRMARKTLCLELWLDTLPQEETDRGHFAHSWEDLRNGLWNRGFPRVEIVGTSANGRALVQAWREVHGYAVPKEELLYKDGQWEVVADPADALANTGTENTCIATIGNSIFLLKLINRRLEERRWIYSQCHPAFVSGNVFQEKDTHYVAIPWLPLQTWKPTPNRIKLVRQGLQWLHSKGYIHGDITSGHLRPVPGGVKIIDYGGLTRIGQPFEFPRTGHVISGDNLIATPVLDWTSFRATF